MVPRDYRLTVRENGATIDDRPLEDPFHTTTVHVRGWRSAWKVLRRRLAIEVRVDGSPSTIAYVMSDDYEKENPDGRV